MPRRLVQAALRRRQQRLRFGVQLARIGDFPAEVARDHAQNAVNQIAVGGDELIVVSADEIRPVEFGIAGFGHVGGERVADGIHVVTLQNVGNPHRPVAACGNLVAFNVQVLVGGNVVRQVQPAVSHEHGGPDDGVEGYVVFAHEVVGARVRVLPEIAPAVGFAAARRPLFRGGQVADDRLEPDVDALVVVAVERDGDAPVEVAGDSPVFQAAFEKADGEVADVGLEVVLPPHPFEQLVFEGAQAHEEVFGFAYLRRAAAQSAGHADELFGVERPSAGVALVAARAVVAAVRTLAFDVAVGQEAVVGRAVRLLHRVVVDEALFAHPREHVLGDIGVVVGVGGGEQVEADAEPLPRPQKLALVSREDVFRRHAALVGGDGHRRPVSVAAGHHSDLAAEHPLKASENIRRQVAARRLSDVDGAVGVGPSDAYEYSISQKSRPQKRAQSGFRGQ